MEAIRKWDSVWSRFFRWLKKNSASEMEIQRARPRNRPPFQWPLAELWPLKGSDSASATKYSIAGWKGAESWAILANSASGKVSFNKRGNALAENGSCQSATSLWPRRPSRELPEFPFRSLNFFQPAEKSRSNGVPFTAFPVGFIAAMSKRFLTPE